MGIGLIAFGFNVWVSRLDLVGGLLGLAVGDFGLVGIVCDVDYWC